MANRKSVWIIMAAGLFSVHAFWANGVVAVAKPEDVAARDQAAQRRNKPAREISSSGPCGKVEVRRFHFGGYRRNGAVGNAR